MTLFQEKCISECMTFFQSIGLHAAFNKAAGREEEYYITSITADSTVVDVYIYVDEAGVMVNKTDWLSCERPDFDSDTELISALIHKISEVLSKV